MEPASEHSSPSYVSPSSWGSFPCKLSNGYSFFPRDILLRQNLDRQPYRPHRHAYYIDLHCTYRFIHIFTHLVKNGGILWKRFQTERNCTRTHYCCPCTVILFITLADCKECDKCLGTGKYHWSNITTFFFW